MTKLEKYKKVNKHIVKLYMRTQYENSADTLTLQLYKHKRLIRNSYHTEYYVKLKINGKKRWFVIPFILTSDSYEINKNGNKILYMEFEDGRVFDLVK